MASNMLTNMVTNWQVNNPSILQNYSSGYKLLVNHSLLSKIPFKKMSLLLELCVMFLQQKHCLHSLIKRCTWNEGQGRSLVKCPPLEASRWIQVLATCAGCCAGPCPGPSFGLASFSCSTVQLDSSICLCLHRFNTCWFLNTLKTSAAHGVQGSWSLNGTAGWFLALKIHILSNIILSPILLQIFMYRGNSTRCWSPVSYNWHMGWGEGGHLQLDLPFMPRNQILFARDPVKDWAS